MKRLKQGEGFIYVVLCVNWSCVSLNSYPSTPEPIDWDYYKSKLTNKSALVDSFKKQVIYFVLDSLDGVA